MNTLLPPALDHSWTTAAAAAVLVVLAAAALAHRRSSRTPVAVLCAALAAAACTAYSADTSWRFAADHLGMASTGERAAMFAAGELALFSTALMARQNLRTTGAPGTPGVLVWVITGVQVIPAFAESGFWGGTVRAFIGPILAALLWHLAMGIELRHTTPGAESQALHAVLTREVRERLLSRLGLAVRDRTAEQITRDRATLRAVALAARLAEMEPARRSGWRGRRTAQRLSVAVGQAQAGADRTQRAVLLQLLAARRHAAALATVDLPSPWQDDRRATAPVTPHPAMPVVTLPPVPAAPAPTPMTGAMTTPVTAVPSAQPVRQVVRQVVTQVVTPVVTPPEPSPAGWMTEGGIRRRARQLNRHALRDTGRAVTIDTLRTDLGLSRREATALRREITGRDNP